MPGHIKIKGNYEIFIPGRYRGDHRPRKRPARNLFGDLNNKKPHEPLSPEKLSENYNQLTQREKVPGAQLASSPPKNASPKKEGDGSWLFVASGRTVAKNREETKSWSAGLFQPSKAVQCKTTYKEATHEKTLLPR